ncbi:MAG TPA: LamG-like jellyroll fold domain-containing protein [Chthonomonadales bacterium]|nr:LamG-like jellyroll fold domain-containing protein [Chthonomonadales bacterium]
MRPGRLLAAAAALAALPAGSGTPALRSPETPRFAFETDAEGWSSVTGALEQVSVARAARPGSAGSRSLAFTFRPVRGRIDGVARTVGGAGGAGVRTWLRASHAATLVLGLIERDGSAYMLPVPLLPLTWKRVEAPYSAFRLSDDSRDENGGLDPDQVGRLVIADAAGLLPGADAERTFWVDDYEIASNLAAAPRPYRPLLAEGLPSPSGARATAGVTYVPGRFGRAMLADAPGELVAVPVHRSPGSRWPQGTVEMWVSPRFDMERVRDFSALLSMAEEPFVTGFRGGISLFYTGTRQMVAMLNGREDAMAASPPLAWKAGAWHHLAFSWGPAGIRLYLDGQPVGRGAFAGGPAIVAGDVVVGNQAWTILANRPSRTAIDDLRISRRQRTDAEVAASASATGPLRRDVDTLALERFDGTPAPPITLAPGPATLRSVAAGRSFDLEARLPSAPPGGARLAVRVVSAGGTALVAAERPVRATSGGALARFVVPAVTVPGLHRVELRLRSGGSTINAGGGWVRVTPAGGAPPAAPALGASMCFAEIEDPETFFRRAAQAGVRTLRLPFEWAEIEPERGRFVWAKYDRIVAAAERWRVELVPTFIWERAQPAWAGRGMVQRGMDQHRYPPEDLERWKVFVRQVVARYRRTIRWWIPANEPNLAKYWHPAPDPKAYVALLRATREAARAADPGARIVGLSVSGIDLRFMEAAFREGALRYCDAVGVHPYMAPHRPDDRIPINILDPGSPLGTLRDGLRMAGALIRRHGGAQPIWLTEAGQPYRDDFIVPGWGVPESVAAERLAMICAEALASGEVDRVLWFSFWGGDYGSFALLAPDGTPTLPSVAFVAASERMHRARPGPPPDRGAGVRALAFERPGAEVHVVWRRSGSGALALRPGERAFDLYGVPLSAANASRRLALTSRPVYLERPVRDAARSRSR